MRLGAYQFAVNGNIQDNLAKIRDAVCRSAESGVRLLVFPECALTGYPPRDIPSSESVDFVLLDGAHNELQKLADRFALYLIVGTMTKAEDSIFNTALCFSLGSRPLHIANVPSGAGIGTTSFLETNPESWKSTG